VIEGIIGKPLKGRRDNIVLATKAHLPVGDDPNQQGNSRRWFTRDRGMRTEDWGLRNEECPPLLCRRTLSTTIPRTED
jgi:hypothetical protein